MKHLIITWITTALSAVLLSACASETSFDIPGMPDVNGGGNSSGGGEGFISGLTDFNITFDYTPLSNETEPECEEIYQPASLGTVPQISIIYTADKVTVNGVIADKGSEIDTEGGKITISDGNAVSVSCKASANYVLSSGGKEVNGSFALKKNTMDNIVTLNNALLTYSEIQGKGLSAAKEGTLFLNIPDGTVNSISSYKKCISCGQDPTEEGNESFVGGNVVISGGGTLNLTSGTAGALYSEGGTVYLHKGTILGIKPASGKHGIAGYKGVTIAGGVQNIQLSGDGPKGVKSDGAIQFLGGRTTVINEGHAVWDEEKGDYSSAICVKGGDIYVAGGCLLCLATGDGGKGVRADNTMTIKSGMVKVATEGQNLVRTNNTDKAYTSIDNMNSSLVDANPKGIHVGDKDAVPATGTLVIDGGDVRVRTKYSEAIESKMTMTINGGNVQAYASDDAINVGISSESNRGNDYAGKGNITINGGNILAYSTSNDAIDSNGTITINDGFILAFGATGAECGMDCDNNTFLINGGCVLAFGGKNISTPVTSSSQPVLIMSCSIVKGNTYTLGTHSFSAPSSYSNATVVLSDPSFKVGNSITFAGASATLTSQITGGNIGMGGGPGWFPGGRW